MGFKPEYYVASHTQTLYNVRNTWQSTHMHMSGFSENSFQVAHVNTIVECIGTYTCTCMYTSHMYIHACILHTTLLHTYIHLCHITCIYYVHFTHLCPCIYIHVYCTGLCYINIIIILHMESLVIIDCLERNDILV